MIRHALAKLLLILCLLPLSAGASEFPRDENQIWGMAASHQWKDFDLGDGSGRTDDKGLSAGLGWEGMFEGDSYTGFWRPRLAAYVGRSDYTEKTPPGDLSSTTRLSGMSAELDYLFRIGVSQSFALEPVVGLALRMDRRVIGAGSAGSAADNNLVVRGRYREERRGFMGRLGLRAVVGELGGVGDERTLGDFAARHLFVEGGLLLPAYMEYQGGIDGRRIATRLYPGLYLEAGGRIGRWIPTVFFERMEYDAGGKKQAESSVVGARVGMKF
jgi:hypothetical protein